MLVPKKTQNDEINSESALEKAYMQGSDSSRMTKVMNIAVQVKVARRKMATMSMQRVMWVMSIVARTSDLCIAMSVVDPNPFVSHTVTMGLSGLASALVGWYQQQWPD